MPSLLNRIMRAQNGTETDNIQKMTSDIAVDVIKRMGGTGQENKAVIDNYIVITGIAGGTGASTIACNVAYTAAAMKLHVLLIDMNILCPIQHTFLGLRSDQDRPDLTTYILGRNKLADSIINTPYYDVMYSCNRNLTDVINCGSDSSISTFDDMMMKLRDLYDVIILDCPMRIDDMLCNDALYNCDAIYSVWDEGLGAISNADRIRRNLAFTGVDSYTKMRAILNKRTSVKYTTYPFQKLNIELLGILPFSTDVIDSSLRGQIFCDKGTATHKNAAQFVNGIQEVTEKILKIGGLLRDAD